MLPAVNGWLLNRSYGNHQPLLFSALLVIVVVSDKSAFMFMEPFPVFPNAFWGIALEMVNENGKKK